MEPNKNKTISNLQILLMLGCCIGGLLAGGNVYRYVIEVPAWQQMDKLSWAEYSQHADLKNGIFLFPFEAIASAFFFIFASVILLRKKNILAGGTAWIYLASVFAIAGLVLTFFAAPYMLSLRTIGNDPVRLQETFNKFHFWGLLRAIVQVLSFLASVLGLAKLTTLKHIGT
jgi:hypothetical protein